MAEFENGNPNNNSDYYQNSNGQNLNGQNLTNQNTNNYYVNNQSANNQNPNNPSANNQNPYSQNPYQQNPYQQNTYNQNPNKQMPEYSFWAEQMPGGAHQNYNQGANSWEYGNNPNTANHNMYYQNEKPHAKKEPKQHKVLGFVGKALCFGLIAGLVIVGISQLVYTINPNSAAFMSQIERAALNEKKYEIGYTSQGDIKQENKSAISSIVDKTMSAIVSINCTSTQTTDWFGQEYSQDVEGSGSGFIVGKDEKELLVATNNHVVEGAKKIAVTFNDGTTADAVIKGTDATADLAVLSIDISTMKQSTLDVISIAKLGNSDQVKVGEMAIAIGNALGYGQSVTVGYISAKDREIEVQSDNYNTRKMVLLQTDAAINPGNSGGALLNVDGEVIGINTIKYASDEIEGMGYAIPITKATSIINELMTREILAEEEQGYLGIAGNDVTEDVASYYNLPIGVFINEVVKGGAAEKGGLLPNDIITKVDDIEITSISQLREYVTSKRTGTKVTVTYMRKAANEYKEVTVTISLGKNPNLSEN